MSSSLHTHSTFSKLDAYGLPEQIVIRSLEFGLKALAITDHANTAAHPKLEMACEKYGKCKSCSRIMNMKDTDHLCVDPEWERVKPLYGIELYLNTKRQRKNHITIIAKDAEGYKNLVALASLAYTEGKFYYLPCVDLEDVIQYQKGLIVLSGCMSGVPSELINLGKIDEAQKIISYLNDNIEFFYIEVQPLDVTYTMEDEDKLDVIVTSENLTSTLISIAKELKLPMVATNDAHYIRPEDKWYQHFLAMVRRKKNVRNFPDSMSNRCRLAGENDFKEWLEPYGKSVTEECINNQDKIADLCENYKLPKAAPMKWSDRPDEERYQELVTLCNQGWEYRKQNKYSDKNKRKEQGQYELGLIKEKGFYDYFLIVADMVKWAKENNIMVGPARGSVAASLVSYLTRITEVDPIHFKLLFERFLDPSRNDTPDIDLDFQDDRRDEIKDYMKGKWGENKVKNVAGYTMYHEKGLLDDIGRCYCVSPNNIEEYKKKLISEGGKFEFTAVIHLMEDVCTPRIPKGMEKMLGQLRGFTVHAAGLVISSEPLNNITTIMGDKIALDKTDAEYLNILKIDVLSLTTLRVIALALEKIGIKVEDLYNLPLDNKEVFEGFKKGHMQGIFQYAGNTTRNVCMKALRDVNIGEADLQTVFDVITDVNTLSRPASMNNGSTTRYIAKTIENIHPLITKHTQTTRGQIIYQEQIMRALRDAGVEWKDVTMVRKIIQKKGKPEEMPRIKQVFINNLMKDGTTLEIANKVWNRLGDEGAYGFNIAHCVAYTLIAYYTMWLKIFHPLVFYWANMMVSPEDNEMLREFAQTGGHVYEVRFGMSQVHWSIDETRNGLRAGYITIKGIGEKTAMKLVEMQESHRLSSGDIEIGVKDFSTKQFSLLNDANAFDDDAEIHDYLGFLDLRKVIKETPGCVSLKDIMDGDMVSIICKVSDFKVKNLREYYKKNGKDYNEVQQGELDTYVNMKVFDEDGELQLTLSRYKFPTFKKLFEEIDKDKIYEILLNYSGSKDKGYIMNIMEAGSINEGIIKQ